MDADSHKREELFKSIIGLADTLYTREHFAEAALLYTEAINMKPDHADSLNSRAVTFARLERFPEAYDDLKQAITLKPWNGVYYFNLYQVARALGDEIAAQGYYDLYREFCERACPYFSDRRRDRLEEMPITRELSEFDYSRLLVNGYRRTGSTLSRNICGECAACVQIRILVQDFQPTRGQRRNLRKASSIERVFNKVSSLSQGKAELYSSYVNERHNWKRGDYSGEAREIHEGYSRATEINYLLGGRLVAVGLVDRAEDSLYASGFYYSKEISHYSPGVLNILSMISYGRDLGKKYLYLGEFIDEKSNMRYKRAFWPHEILKNGEWILESAPEA